MTDKPEVSVVMSVYNRAPQLRQTLESILSQQGVSLEFIIVNDGSTDESGQILAEYAGCDLRVKVLQQDNLGLTRALIRGCAEARGEFIARQDVGDLSISDRLLKQVGAFRRNSDVALCSCATRFLGPLGEHLYDVIQDPRSATDTLKVTELSTVKGPSHHGSTMFRRDLYTRIGGYRPEFYFAQDLDLWMRLVDFGRHFPITEVLYRATFSTASLTGQHRAEQVRTARLILECARRRRAGLSETPTLRSVSQIRPTKQSRARSTSGASSLYFIGMCLKKRKDPAARKYFKLALNANPLHLKSAARLLFG